MRSKFVVSMSHSQKELRVASKLLYVHTYTRFNFKRQLTLGRKWAQLRGLRRPNSYHGDDALHLWSVKFFDLSNSKRRCVSGTKRSRCDHTSLCTEPRICHDIPHDSTPRIDFIRQVTVMYTSNYKTL